MLAHEVRVTPRSTNNSTGRDLQSLHIGVRKVAEPLFGTVLLVVLDN